MCHIGSADELIKNARSEGSEQITENIGNDDDSCREFDVEVLAEAHQKNHCHGQQCEQQFVLNAGHPAAQGYDGMHQCERMDNPHRFYFGKSGHLVIFVLLRPRS